MPHKYRAAVIGSGQRGGYGHALERAFADADLFEVVAIADDDAALLAATGKRIGVSKLYADYREMLAREKPEIVSIGPRWISDRVQMVTAAAEAGCHIYLEKPLAATVAEADAMFAACERAGVKCALAHQLRAMPPVQRAFADIRAGKYGKLLRIYAQPGDDARGGGEELVVHGSHFLDLMIALDGQPRWVSGHFLAGDREVTRADKREGREPVGPIAGDSAALMIGFDGGVRGFWNSTAHLDRFGVTYGVTMQCEQALVAMRTRGDVFVYPGPVVEPENDKRAWQKIWIEDWHFTAEHKPAPLTDYILRGNRWLVRELVKAIENKREPQASLRDALLLTEIIQGAYASHLQAGARIPIPLADRKKHPLEA